MNAKRQIAFILLLSTLLLCLTSCARDTAPIQTPTPEVPLPPASSKQSAVGFYLDTSVTISAYGATSEALNALLSECATYEALLSKTIEGSDVYNINHANGAPVTVSGHTRVVLEKALEIATLSGGAFDITIAPATELWDFKSETPTLPDSVALEAAAKLVGYKNISLSGNVVTLPAGMMIDLGGIAKGYIADEIADNCRASGITSGLLNFGGNVVVIGSKPDGSAWNVGIQDPDQPTGAYLAAIPAVNSTVVTSGIYERGFDLDGVRYHHILDTATGWPVQNELSSVTILTQSSMEADALSTTCFALGTEGGMALLREHFPEVNAVFITKDRQVTATEGVAQLLAF